MKLKDLQRKVDELIIRFGDDVNVRVYCIDGYGSFGVSDTLYLRYYPTVDHVVIYPVEEY